MKKASGGGTRERIAFANSLRGIAALLVLITHYVVMFDLTKGAVQGFAPIDGDVYPRWLVGIVRLIPDFDIGAFGVALFFLISGFVIPSSIAGLPDSLRGRLGFVIARVLRIYPTYIAGFCISISVLCFAAVHTGTLAFMPYWNFTQENMINHMTLFRDWYNTPMFDGIVWTLEIEMKFYMFALLFWRGIVNGRGYVFAVIAIAAAMAIPYKPTDMVGMAEPANYFFALRFILFMSVGTAFNYHLRGLIDLNKLFFYATGMLLVFVYCSIEEGVAAQMTVSCAAAFMVFLGLYLFRSEWSGGRALAFLADISFPMYVVHADFGYVGMRWMVEHGLRPLAALPIQIIVTIGLAWVMHKTVECWSHRFGKWLSKMAAGRLTAQPARAGLAATEGHG